MNDPNSLSPIHRLHLGATSPPRLRESVAAALWDSSWLHLGEYDDSLKHQSTETVGGIRLFRLGTAESARHTFFMPFWYDGRTPLPFDDQVFSFMFSEHFLEHLFLDEACELLKECFRVLRPCGCFRIVVPDADLRVYQDPEPAGFTTGGERWTDPGKHKSRWSVHSLPYLLRWIGFDPIPIVYCDREGNYINRSHLLPTPGHENGLEPDWTRRTDYIARIKRSLVIDAIRCPQKPV